MVRFSSAGSALGVERGAGPLQEAPGRCDLLELEVARARCDPLGKQSQRADLGRCACSPAIACSFIRFFAGPVRRRHPGQRMPSLPTGRCSWPGPAGSVRSRSTGRSIAAHLAQ